MICKKCGQLIDDNAKFCPNCGKKNNKKKKASKYVWIILGILVFGVIISNPSKKENNESSTTTERNIKNKKLSYKVVNEGGTSKYVVIDNSFVNSEDLKKLGDKLKNDFSQKETIQVYVFDDETVAKEWNSNFDDDAEKEKHFVALYWKGGIRHDLWIMPEGMNGEKETIIYEERKAKYYVTLNNVSVAMADGAFKITNKSGQDLTNVEMIINYDSPSKKQYNSKTAVIYNGNTFSAGMMTFANKDNELFNPFVMKVQSLTIYCDQGNLWVYAN